MKSHLTNNILKILLISTICGCVTIKKHQNKKLLKHVNERCLICQDHYSKNVSDTTIMIEDYACVYTNGKLIKTGKFSNNQEKGKWYFFDEEGKVDKIVKYHPSKNESTLIYRSYTVNESW